VRAQDLQGNDLDFVAEGFLARIIQHETDHLDGRVFLDRVDILTRQSKLVEWEEVRQSLESAAPLG
jgi:peptide deformylase